jgi:hypothetical protein
MKASFTPAEAKKIVNDLERKDGLHIHVYWDHAERCYTMWVNGAFVDCDSPPGLLNTLRDILVRNDG